MSGLAQRAVRVVASERFVAAAVQAEPVWLDVDGCVDKAVALITTAAEQGASLVAFPEVWIPGYPAWIWVGSPLWGIQFVPRYHENSVVVGDRSFERLRQAAADNSIAVVMGASERSAGSLYMAQFLFDAAGEVVGTRRKLKPTGAERALFGEGDGSDLLVREVRGVGRLGALNCWEHLQPLTKFALYGMHEQVHVAAWPNLADPQAYYALSHEANLRVSQVYAMEGGCYVLAATTMLGSPGLALFAQGDDERARGLCGGSGGYAEVFAPDGRPIGRRLPPEQEGLVFADLDLGLLPLARSLQDPTGHYQRGDVTQLWVNTQPRRPVVFTGAPGSAAEPVAHDASLAPAPDGTLMVRRPSPPPRADERETK